LGEPSRDTVAGLSPIIAGPYQFAGKLCVTLPLGVFGVVLLVGSVSATIRAGATIPAAPSRAARVAALLEESIHDAETLEFGEPIPEEIQPRALRR
jgi:hypothetical protein